MLMRRYFVIFDVYPFAMVVIIYSFSSLIYLLTPQYILEKYNTEKKYIFFSVLYFSNSGLLQRS